MHRRTIIPFASTALVLLVALLAGACGQPASPEEEVSELRSKYSAKLNSFVVQQEPMEPEGAMEGEAEEAAPAEASAEEGEGQAVEGDEGMTEPVPTTQDVLLDILVSTTSRDTLSGLTVDITQIDAQEQVKETWRTYLDTSAVHRGPGTQVSHTLENVEYEEGDGFNVEVRHPVPPEERGEYREFQEYGSEG